MYIFLLVFLSSISISLCLDIAIKYFALWYISLFFLVYINVSYFVCKFVWFIGRSSYRFCFLKHNKHIIIFTQFSHCYTKCATIRISRDRTPMCNDMKFSDLRICSVVSLGELAYIYGDPIRIIITSYGLSIEHLDFVLFMLLSFFDLISIIVL
jgi:hypothetical protein